VQEFQTFYQENLGLIYRYVYSKVGNREEAEDLTGEVFLKAARLLDPSRDEASQLAWLRQAARTTLADHWRRWYRVPTAELEDLPVPQLGADDPTESSWPGRTSLATLLACLPENYRRVLELRFLEGYTVRETATAMGLSVGNVKVLQYRAIQRAAQLSLAAETRAEAPDERPG
jgi:RNA polymerase sigma-70 factor (ECF subfamily)